MSTKFGVLFVCMGNICRSPTAHGVFQHKVNQLGLQGKITVDSAGTLDYHAGSPPDERASGATVTCLDQPYAALDLASIKVIREFLSDMAEHATRSWVVADYVADPGLAWKQVISLDRSKVGPTCQ
jgi:hypothetical protein